MKKYLTKKSFIFVFFLLLLTVFISVFTNRKEDAALHVASSFTLFDKLPTSPPPLPTLHYGDINLHTLMSYDYESPDNLVVSEQSYKAYTEGFIEESIYHSLINAIQSTSPQAPDYFLNYFIHDNQAFVAYSGDLSSIYVVDLLTHTASQLSFEASQNLGEMYVYHMQVVGDTLIILAGEANSYHASIYTVDLGTLSVISSKRIATSEEALYKEDFAITPTGECLFIDNQGVLSYNPFTDTIKTYPLPWTPSRILTSQHNTFAVTEEGSTLRLTNLATNHEQVFTLPASDLKVMALTLKGDFLYSLLYDPHATLYHNYLNIYDLQTGEWLYSLGLTTLSPDFALLGYTF